MASDPSDARTFRAVAVELDQPETEWLGAGIGHNAGMLERGSAPARVHIVVDGGVDDALALAVLMGAQVPIAQIVATEGSRPLAQTAVTTARLALTLGSDVAVRLGAGSGIAGPYPEGRDPFHGQDCFGGKCDLLDPAVLPVDSWAPLDGPVFATGALTVVASALTDGHEVASVTWMGGSVGCGGNMTASAEFNAWMDPEAVDMVFRSGHVTKMIPLDVTGQFRWGTEEVRALTGCSRGGALIGAAAEALVIRDGAFVPHDAVAAAALLDPDLFRWAWRNVRCETAGLLTRGETVVDRRPQGSGGQTLIAEAADIARVNALILDAVSSIAP